MSEARSSSRLARGIAFLGLGLAAAGLAVAVGVDRIGHFETLTETTTGGPTYTGVFGSWVDVPTRPLAAISVAVLALSATVLTNSWSRARRVVVVLLATGEVALALVLGFLLVEYLQTLG